MLNVGDQIILGFAILLAGVGAAAVYEFRSDFDGAFLSIGPPVVLVGKMIDGWPAYLLLVFGGSVFVYTSLIVRDRVGRPIELIEWNRNARAAGIKVPAQVEYVDRNIYQTVYGVHWIWKMFSFLVISLTAITQVGLLLLVCGIGYGLYRITSMLVSVDSPLSDQRKVAIIDATPGTDYVV